MRKDEKIQITSRGEEEKAENCCEKLSRKEKIPEVVFHGKTFDFVGGLDELEKDQKIVRMMED
jgi:hypothetical protein